MNRLTQSVTLVNLKHMNLTKVGTIRAKELGAAVYELSSEKIASALINIMGPGGRKTS